MTVPMMDVRKVHMAVAEGIMLVTVRVRLGAVPRKIVFMAMMLVMGVGVCMRQRLVPVQVPVAFGEMQRNADRHQDRRYPEKRVGRLAKQRKRRGRPDKRGGRKISAGPSSAELPQRHHEKSKAHSIAEQADQSSSGGDLKWRKGGSKTPRHAKVHRSGRQPFDARDLDRVPGGNLAREV